MSPDTHPGPQVAVGIATRGRPDILAETLQELARQTVQPARTVVCCTEPADIEGIVFGPNVEVIFSPSGLPRQRNAIVDRLPGMDVVLFIDDDFLMAPAYIAAVVDAFDRDRSIVVTTGDTIADGAKGPGIGPAEARAMIAADTPGCHGMIPAPHGYGCNMAIRLSAAREHGIRFDERLPLYAWSEDMDFTHRLGRHGRMVKLLGARGVHLGTKRGRTSGRRLGYSQVANPIYLFQKGSYTLGRAGRSVGRNLAANVMRSLRPEPWIDRRGRLRGNLRAMLDMLRGRMSPERILEL